MWKESVVLIIFNAGSSCSDGQMSSATAYIAVRIQRGITNQTQASISGADWHTRFLMRHMQKP